jgi:AraC family ethanolamine operon transcriptional activator
MQRSKWELDSLMAGALHVQNGRTGSPVIAEAAADPGGLLFFIPVTGRHMINGHAGDDQMVLLAPGGADFTIAVQDEFEWVSVFVPQELRGSEEPRAYCDWRGSRIGRPGKEQVARLRSFLSGILRNAQIEPTVLTAPAALAAMQADVLAACRSVVRCEPTIPTTGRPLVPRAHIIRTAKALIEGCEDEVLGIDDLARAADVSVRTLQTAFLDYFGIPPHRYLTLRRLHQVREALRRADLDETTVTRIAARFGFWQFGRFAGQYRRLFGELPSATLARSDSAVAIS